MSKRYESMDDVKKELKISDFSKMSDEQINRFIPMIPEIDKDIAFKIIEQLPDYSKVASETINSFTLMSKETMKKADDGAKKTIMSYQKIIDTIAKHLEDGELSKEEQKQDINKMIELAREIDEINDKNNKHLLEIVKLHSKNVMKVAGMVGVAVVAVVLGTKGNSKK